MPTNPPDNQPAARPAQARVVLTGETVTITYVSDPVMGHGEFRLRNDEDAAIVVAVESAWLQLGDQRRALDHVELFDVDHERPVDAGHFEVGPRQTAHFLVGFPSTPYQPPFGSSTAVGVQLRAGSTELTALSPIDFVRRVPRIP